MARRQTRLRPPRRLQAPPRPSRVLATRKSRTPPRRRKVSHRNYRRFRRRLTSWRFRRSMSARCIGASRAAPPTRCGAPASAATTSISKHCRFSPMRCNAPPTPDFPAKNRPAERRKISRRPRRPNHRCDNKTRPPTTALSRQIGSASTRQRGQRLKSRLESLRLAVRLRGLRDLAFQPRLQSLARANSLAFPALKNRSIAPPIFPASRVLAAHSSSRKLRR